MCVIQIYIYQLNIMSSYLQLMPWFLGLVTVGLDHLCILHTSLVPAALSLTADLSLSDRMWNLSGWVCGS